MNSAMLTGLHLEGAVTSPRSSPPDVAHDDLENDLDTAFYDHHEYLYYDNDKYVNLTDCIF